MGVGTRPYVYAPQERHSRGGDEPRPCAFAPQAPVGADAHIGPRVRPSQK
ncbi:hypothetical protein K200098A10_38950 [Flavonifractor plautii]